MSASSSSRPSSSTTSCPCGCRTAWRSWRTCPTACQPSRTSSRCGAPGTARQAGAARLPRSRRRGARSCWLRQLAASRRAARRPQQLPPAPVVGANAGTGARLHHAHSPLECVSISPSAFGCLMPDANLRACPCSQTRRCATGMWSRSASCVASPRSATPRTSCSSRACCSTSTGGTPTWCPSWRWAWRVRARATGPPLLLPGFDACTAAPLGCPFADLCCSCSCIAASCTAASPH